MTTTNNPTTGKSLYDVALASAIKAARDDDSAAFTGVTSVSLLMVARVIQKIDDDKAAQLVETAEKECRKVFTVLIKKMAARGTMVWRHSQPKIDALMALKGKDRENAVSMYIDGGKTADPRYGKPEGAKLAEGLAKLRTWSWRLVEHVAANHAAIVRDIIAKRDAGASGDALQEVFTEFVRNTYGKSFAALSDSLKPVAAKAKDETPAWEKIAKRAADLPELELARLIAHLEGLRLERASIAEDLEQAGAPTSELIPATPEAVAA
jgi:hypothetical protein